jgi:hypothetical protein
MKLKTELQVPQMNGQKKQKNVPKKDSFEWFFDVFASQAEDVATFEEPVKKPSGNQGLRTWKGTLLVEHKSKGKPWQSFEQGNRLFSWS